MTDTIVPAEQRLKFLADGNYWLAVAIYRLAETGGIPSEEEKQKAGEESIALARKALELQKQLDGTMESIDVAGDMGSLSDILDYFNNVDDEEVFRLIKQAIAIYSRVQGNLSSDVASSKHKLGKAYLRKVWRAFKANDMNQCMIDLDIALPHFYEAARIYQVNNLVDSAEAVLCSAGYLDRIMRRIITNRAVPRPSSSASPPSASSVVETVPPPPASSLVVETVPPPAVVELPTTASAAAVALAREATTAEANNEKDG